MRRRSSTRREQTFVTRASRSVAPAVRARVVGAFSRAFSRASSFPSDAYFARFRAMCAFSRILFASASPGERWLTARIAECPNVRMSERTDAPFVTREKS